MRLTSVASILATLMCAAAIASVTSTEECRWPAAALYRAVPVTFRDWTEVSVEPIVGGPTIDFNYDIREVVTRTYVHRRGDRVRVAIMNLDEPDRPRVPTAHDRPRGGGSPETFYAALGFEVETLGDGTLPTPFGDINVRRFTTSMGARREPVTYWLKIGDKVVRTDFDKYIELTRLRLTGKCIDRLLFRVSSNDADAARAFKVQEQFVADMMAAVPPEVRRRLSGLKPSGAT